MVEDAPANWQDETLGDKLLDMLHMMKTFLGKRKLSNYFVRKQNMFGEIPR